MCVMNDRTTETANVVAAVAGAGDDSPLAMASAYRVSLSIALISALLSYRVMSIVSLLSMARKVNRTIVAEGTPFL